MVQILAKVIFLENGHVPEFQDMWFSRNKSPCGSVPQKVTFSELTLRELIHFYRDFKNQLFPKNRDFDDNLPIKFQFLPKTKMVRMVHRNNFCEMGLEISDQKKELWTKTVFWRGGKFRNSVLRSRVDFWGFLQDQNWFWKYSGPFLNHSRPNFI